jgi:predicted neutral ceramidase superfamily lipid hydrolase
LGLATNGIYDLAKLTMTRAIGDEPESISEDVENLNKRRSGDVDALVEAIEPALKKAHYGVGGTIKEIVIEETTTKRTIVKFDEHSKSYLQDSIEADDDAQDVAISALNVNDRTGRAYFLDLKRTIPFRVSRDADPKTISVLSAGIDRYANKLPAPIRITFARVEAVDGRLKRIVILKAEDVSDEE